MNKQLLTWPIVICLAVVLGMIAGCAGLEYAPKRQYLYYHKELPAADRAVEAARAAGKDKECPTEFAAAEKMKNDAYEIYWACRTQEAIAKANEATARANALCPRRAEAPPPPVAAPPPPAPAAPTVSIAADPADVQQGKCAKLSWTSTAAAAATIDQGIGNVDPGGSREVCPTVTTKYTISVTGEGGSRTASTTVTVTPPPPEPKVVDRLAIHVNFDTDKADIRKADAAELQKAIDFVKKYPGYSISVEGHTDNRGKAAYNQALSERRAAAVKKYLVDHGVENGQRIKTAGYGFSRPIADNKTEKGRFENRRVEILILSE